MTVSVYFGEWKKFCFALHEGVNNKFQQHSGVHESVVVGVVVLNSECVPT